jgi:hypothetical protein
MKILGYLNEEDLKKYKDGDKSVVDKYLGEADDGGGEGDSNDVSSLSTGLRRIAYKFGKANTPPKYVEAFTLVATLVSNFPLKSKIIWKAVGDAYTARFAE